MSGPRGKKIGSHSGGLDVVEHAVTHEDFLALGDPLLMEPAQPMPVGTKMPVPTPEVGGFIRTSSGGIEVAAIIEMHGQEVYVGRDGSLWVEGRGIHAHYKPFGEADS